MPSAEALLAHPTQLVNSVSHQHLLLSEVVFHRVCFLLFLLWMRFFLSHRSSPFSPMPTHPPPESFKATSSHLPAPNPQQPPRSEATLHPFKPCCDLFLYPYFDNFCNSSLIVNFHVLSPWLQINSGQGLFNIPFSFP